VAQAQPPQGLGLKFQTLDSKGISKLSLLLERVRAAFLAQARGAVYECDEGSRR
jgi:hypothetical protein